MTLEVMEGSPITPWYDRKVGSVLFWRFVGFLGCFVCRVANLACLDSGKSLFLLRKSELGDSRSHGGQSYYTMV